MFYVSDFGVTRFRQLEVQEGNSNGEQREEEETGGLSLHDSSSEEEENPAASEREPGDGRAGEEHDKLADERDFSRDDYEKQNCC